MAHIAGTDRTQAVLLPDVLDDYVRPDNPVRFLEAGLTPLVPRPLTSANEARGLFTKDDFAYDPAADRYRCPAGETLTYRTTQPQFAGDMQHGTGQT